MKYKIGQRLECVEGGLFDVKVCDRRVDEDGNDEYLVRMYNHPHDVFWTDDQHLQTPFGRRHDETYPEPIEWFKPFCKKCRVRDAQKGRDLCYDCEKVECYYNHL